MSAIPKRMIAALRDDPASKLEVETTELKFKDLRVTAVVRLREAGCSLDDICAITGHTNPATVHEHYLSASAAVTRTVLEKRLAHEEGKKG